MQAQEEHNGYEIYLRFFILNEEVERQTTATCSTKCLRGNIGESAIREHMQRLSLKKPY